MRNAEAARRHLTQTLIPFWSALHDDAHGGFYGHMDNRLQLDRRAVKGCILHSRILWFFASAYQMLGDEALLSNARHAYQFLTERCIDRDNGGVYWSVTYDGQPSDTTKHTYNQAFAVYALSAYYRASGDTQALALAKELFLLIETRCRDACGYREAFDRAFRPVSNDKLSENGVIATRTMNTLLHVFEAYTGLYAAGGGQAVADCLRGILDMFAERVYHPIKKRQELFFDDDWHTLADVHSFGHDIETAWLMDYGCRVLGDAQYCKKMARITAELEQCVYQTAYSNHSLANEAENGVIDQDRIWWVQAEGVVGFLNAYQKNPCRTEYLQAAEDIWDFIMEHVVDKRPGAEWIWRVSPDGTHDADDPVVGEWKCPYHNGRMCMEIMRRCAE